MVEVTVVFGGLERELGSMVIVVRFRGVVRVCMCNLSSGSVLVNGIVFWVEGVTGGTRNCPSNGTSREPKLWGLHYQRVDNRKGGRKYLGNEGFAGGSRRILVRW
jgi:hypothetical protein